MSELAENLATMVVYQRETDGFAKEAAGGLSSLISQNPEIVGALTGAGIGGIGARSLAKRKGFDNANTFGILGALLGAGAGGGLGHLSRGRQSFDNPKDMLIGSQKVTATPRQALEAITLSNYQNMEGGNASGLDRWDPALAAAAGTGYASAGGLASRLKDSQGLVRGLAGNTVDTVGKIPGIRSLPDNPITTAPSAGKNLRNFGRGAGAFAGFDLIRELRKMKGNRARYNQLKSELANRGIN